MDPLYLLIVWTIAAIVLIGIASAIDVIIASRLGYPRRRRVFVALISFLVLSVGFLAIMLLLLHWAAPSTL
jgi:Na+-driven multidrug efflux pump